MKLTRFPGAIYNKKFAKAVIKAYVMGKRTFMFEAFKYQTSGFINNVRKDLENGYYKIELRKGCGL